MKQKHENGADGHSDEPSDDEVVDEKDFKLKEEDEVNDYEDEVGPQSDTKDDSPAKKRKLSMNKVKKKVKKKKKNDNPKSKEPIGKTRIWKQAAAINSLLKKGRLFEIRKLLRRVDNMRRKKGSDAQQAKNHRKVDRLLREVTAMKDFIMETLTARTVAVLSDKADHEDAELFTAACGDKQELDAMLQRLSTATAANMSVDNKEGMYARIAYLRILSCVDVLPKLKLIKGGVNVNPRKNKTKAKRSKNKHERNAKNKFVRKHPSKEELVFTADETNAADATIESIQPVSPKKTTKKLSAMTYNNECQNSKPSAEQSIEELPFSIADDTFTFAGDSFFLDSMNAINNSEMSTDDEFSAPVTAAQTVSPVKIKSMKHDVEHSNQSDILNKKKKPNRMGQRQRQKLQEQGQTSSKAGAKARTLDRKHFSMRNDKSMTSKFVKIPNTKRIRTSIGGKALLNDSLHPSWLAKLKAHKAEASTTFRGTKIKFDD